MSQKTDNKSTEVKGLMTIKEDNQITREPKQLSDDNKTRKTLFNKIQTAKLESGDNNMEFIRSLFLIIIGSIAGIAALFIANAVPIAMIIIGSVYINDCRLRPGIPIILVINGGIILIQSSLETVKKYRINSKPEQESDINRKFKWISIGFTIASIVCFISTCVLVYGSQWPKFDNHRSDHFCNPTLFLFSYWMLNIVFIFIAYVLAIALLASVYACLIA